MTPTSNTLPLSPSLKCLTTNPWFQNKMSLKMSHYCLQLNNGLVVYGTQNDTEIQCFSERDVYDFEWICHRTILVRLDEPS